MHKRLKQFLLTIALTIYTFFVPFVIINCSGAPDSPYALDPNVTASESDATILEECQNMEFLIQECVDVLQEENDRVATEQANVEAASLILDDFSACELYDDTTTETLVKMAATSTSTSTSTDEDLTACPETIASVVDAYQACDGLDADERYDECDDIIDTVEDATDLCDDDDETVSEDFCALLSA